MFPDFSSPGLHRKLCGIGVLVLLLVIAVPLAAHSLRGNRTGSPPEDFTLSIFAIGAWAGDFDIDADGRGGLAALHTIVETRRRELNAGQQGAVLLVQAGDFTGAQSAEEFRQRMLYPEVNLARYLRFDALGGSAQEVAYHYAGRTLPEFATMPLVSFNFRPAVAGRAAGFQPFRLVRRSSYTTFVTALTSGQEPLFGTEPEALLGQEMRRQDGADLYVLLLDRHAQPTAEAAVDPHDLHPEPQTNEDAAPYLNAAEILQRPEFWSEFFPEPGDPNTLPSDDAPFARQWLMIESNAARNRFQRLAAGPYLCSITGRSVCEITVEFRKHRVRGVRAHIFDVNGLAAAHRWLEPDPLLLRVLKKQK